ncbi:hypothetical protein QBC36DRAFT_366168 [Triangularia setosa]|uniref:Uncharacterized protein n=1 Tax=Triangularia setosa TaxID=2587417 RepID=A0AAN7A3Z0_9PEZI|nr:hypothetical protein QBC36DRAFT_366168 [Podospora setosa]
MKLLAITALLLPTTTLAQRVKFTREVFSSGPGCPPASVRPVFSNNNETVTITFDNFRASLPSPPGIREIACSLDIRVTHPQGRSTVNPIATLIGDVNLGAGVTGLVRRNYVVSPTTAKPPTGEINPPPLTFTGPVVTGFIEDDRFSYTENFTAGPGQNRTVSIKLNDATLQLQQNGGNEGSLRQVVYILDIRSQS